MSETSGVIYLLTGQAHAVRTLVSISGLRQHYDGPVTLFTTREESTAIGKLIATDARLCIDHQVTDELAHVPRKNRQFITKVNLMRYAPYDISMYLDGDTLPVGDISPVIEAAAEHQFCATQFNDWVTTGRMMTKRIMRWKTEVGPKIVANGDGEMPIPFSERKGFGREGELWINRLADQALSPSMPAINGGCFAARKNAAILKHWYNLSMLGRRTFICDEVALQLLLREYPSYILEGGRYNCSAHLGTHIKDPVVLHYHGEKHLKRESSQRSWIPAYNRCIEMNLGRIREWTPADDPTLTKFLATPELAK